MTKPHAILFDGSYASVAKLIADNPGIYWDRGTVRVKSKFGSKFANAGDWIVQGPEGEYAPIPDDIYQRMYGEAVNG